MKWLTYRQAAHRVGRSVDTIKRWRRYGMAMSWDQRRRRVEDEGTLLSEYRKRLDHDPVHQLRLRGVLGDTPEELFGLIPLHPPSVINE
ncbi:MAG: hypothetical protein KKF42_03280 [Actinobacteria bacterium]|nr:hypothetical protein [Actinomycetota bacterium]